MNWIKRISRAVLVAAVGLGFGAGNSAWAQKSDNWPNRPIRMIVPAGAGSGTDIMARLMSEKLAHALKQPIAVENKPGANGIIGNDFMAKATPDGYTLLFTNASSVSLNAALRTDLPYDTLKDLKPVVMLSNGGVLLAARPEAQVKNLKDFIAYARAHPGLSYASWGTGSTGHLTMEALNIAHKLKMQHVPYRSMGQILTALLSGEVMVAMIDARSPLAMIKTGKIVPVAMTGSARGPLLPEVPLLSEQGFNLQLDGWYGIMAPPGTPDAIVNRVHEEALRIRSDPALRQTFFELNLPPPPQKTPAQFGAVIRDEIPQWRKIVVTANVKSE
ncbi:tripartite tricarboxylate transporter substrate binding protein [Comamonas sp. lk]|uniref:Bug family tripartite tricarboxylate transporter substrate binding protein n=1 Tax=Comamonas sp. lk TaxID=2201272 RepID=UPI0013CEAD05|nr:tripartite tricarboxylate transporter substrate binding protein [Comamonas sp. lk]